MSSVWGENIKVSLFGESHSKAVGIVIDGLPGGIKLDLENIKFEMERRAPGKDKLSTSRKEKDEFEILSGYFNNKTTGAALCAIIKNTDSRPEDYHKMKDLLRPGHADFTARKRYEGYNDYRGGGQFSGRLTAPISFAGAIARQILESEGILVGSHIKSIGKIEDIGFNETQVSSQLLEDLRKKRIPTIEAEKAVEIEKKILEVKKQGDSIGGLVELVVLNLKPGIGDPFFHSIESRISSLIFSIPGVKAIEFGQGFNMGRMKASESNDEFYIKDGEIKTYTNNSGGLLGGISNGMPILFKVGLKATPSISKTQRTVDIEKQINTTIQVEGRHDPCIVLRALPVLEGATALAILDLIIKRL